MLYYLKKQFFSFLGKSYVYKTPCFFTYNPHHHKVLGKEVRQILNSVHPGDILLRRYDGYLNTIMMRLIDKVEFWGHAGLYVGDNIVIHALGVGVVQEDILDFCRTDSVCVLRPVVSEDIKDQAINKAFQLEKDRTGYDFEFKSNDPNDKKVYCTEMVDECYNWMFKKDYETKLGMSQLYPDGIFESDKVMKIITFKH